MKIQTLCLLAWCAVSPVVQAQSAFPGSLGDFSGGGGGRAAADWGLPGDPGPGDQPASDGAYGGQAPPGALTPGAPQSGSSPREPNPGDQPASDGAYGGQAPPGALTPGAPQSGSGPREPNPGDQPASDGAYGGQAPPGALAPHPDQDGFGPLDDPGDRQYDPSDMSNLNPTIPSSCAEAGSTCRQCVMSAEENIQFNRRYLHIAWSITNSHLVYADRMMKIGDTGSGFHGAMALSWQLGGKPQILEAVADLKKTYKKKYRDYFTNIQASVQKLARCEQDNFATQDLYQQFSAMYLDMIQVRYESPDP